MHSSLNCKSEVLPGEQGLIEETPMPSAQFPSPSPEGDSTQMRQDCMGQREYFSEGTSQQIATFYYMAEMEEDDDGTPSCDRISVEHCISGLDDHEESDEELMEDVEMNDTASFVNLAYMNVNSNGKAAIDSVLEVLEPNDMLETKAYLKRVKHINMGEIPLKPIGLSLSGSGMQLYVKVDSDEQRKLLANATVKYTTKIKKPRGKKSAKPNVNSTTTQTANLPTPIADIRANPKPPGEQNDEEGAVCVSALQMNELVLEKEKLVRQDSHIPRPGSRHYESDVANNNVRGHEPQHCQKGASSQVEGRWKSPQRRIDRRRSASEMAEPDLIKAPPPVERAIYDKGKGQKAQSLISGPSWKFKNGEIDVSTHAEGKRPRIHRDEHTEEEKCMDQRHMYPPGFTSSDLPLKPLTSPPKDCPKKRFDHFTRVGRHGHRNRYSLSSRTVDSPGGSRVNRHDSSSDDEDDPYYEFTNKDKRPMKISSTGLTDNGKTNSRFLTDVPYQPDPDVEMVKVKRELSDPPSLSRTFDKATSSTTIFEANHTSPPPLDAITLAKFTEYTKTMRKDLKQNFRDLSDLIRAFNEEILERNNNRASLSPSNREDASTDQDSMDTKGRCILM